VTPLAGELTVRQLGEMLRERGVAIDACWWNGERSVWHVTVDGRFVYAPDLQDALMLAVSRIDEASRG
jgi:hypothetical protein